MNRLITDEQLDALQALFAEVISLSIPQDLDRLLVISGILEAVKGQPEEESVGGWNAEDMQEACQMHSGFTISDKDADFVLKIVGRRFDASVGMDWDTIWDIAEELACDGEITLLDWKEDQPPI